MKVYIIGMPNAGKTTVAKKVANKLGFGLVNIDQRIESSEGITIKDIFEKFGEPYFRSLETKTLKGLKQLNHDLIVDCGGGVVLNHKNKDLMNGIKIYIERSLDEIIKNLDTEKRPAIKNKPIQHIYDERKEKYIEFADYVVENDSLETTTNLILKIIEDANYHDN